MGVLGTVAFTIFGYGITYGHLAAIGWSIYSNSQRGSQSPTYGFDGKYNTASQQIPIPVVYGHNLVAGNTIFKRVYGEDNDKMAVQIGISEGPIYSISDIKGNDVNINSKCRTKLGNRIQAADSVNAQGQTFPYLAYISAELEANEELSGNPTITSIIQGRKVDEWDDNQWVNRYSKNPAYCLLDFMTNKRYGLGISKDDIDLDSFIDAAEYCNEIVEEGESIERRFELDYVIDFQQSSLDHIQNILATFRGFLVYSNGEFRLKVDGPDDVVQSFTMDNIVADSFQYEKSSLKDRYNRVIVEYTDSQNNWETIGAQYSLDGDISQNGIRDKTIQLLGINRFSQAGRQAKYLQRKAWYCDTYCTFKAGIDSIHCEAGDVVTVSHDLPGWVDKKLRILEIREEENDEMQLVCQEYNVAVYSDKGVVQQITDDTTLPNPFEPPQSVVNLELDKEIKQLDDGTWISNIIVTWSPSNSIFYRYGNVYLSEDNGVTWEYQQRVEGTGYRIRNVEQTKSYRVKVVAENNRGVKENFDSAPTADVTILGKEVPPDDVSNFYIQMSGNNVILKWNKVDDIDIDGYEVRRGTNWNTALIVEEEIKANSINLGELQPGNWTFQVKAKDTSGNYSINPAVAEITTFDTNIKNVVEEFNDNFSEGTHENTARFEIDNQISLATTKINEEYTLNQYSGMTLSEVNDIG